MEHRVKVTVLDKKLFPELQAQYCANPNSGKCACYHVGDEFIFYRNDERDDYWHMGAGTLVKSGQPDEGVLLSPGSYYIDISPIDGTWLSGKVHTPFEGKHHPKQ